MLKIRGCVYGLPIILLILCGSAGGGVAKAASTERAGAASIVTQVANRVKKHRKPARPKPHKRMKAPKHGRQQ